MGIIIKGFSRWIYAPFAWGEWIDIQTFSFGYGAYLLQGRVNAVSNAKRFRVQPTKGFWGTAQIESLDFEKLKAINIVK